MRPLFLLLLASFTLVTACKKENTSPPGTPTTPALVSKVSADLYFHNNLSKPVNLRTYGTAAEYRNSTNPMQSYRLLPGDSILWPVDNIPDTTAFYYDWYTDDYSHNNWGIKVWQPYYINPATPNASYDSLKGKPMNDHMIYLKPTPHMPATSARLNMHFYFTDDYKYKSSARRFMLNNTAPQQRWKAVDMYDGSKSVWSSLSDDKKFMELVLTKDMNATWTFKKNGAIVTEDGRSLLGVNMNSISFYVATFKNDIAGSNIYLPDGQGYLESLSNIRHNAIPIQDYIADTLVMSIFYNKYYTPNVIMVKQP